MRKLATKLTPAIKDWIREEFGSEHYEYDPENNLFAFPNYVTEKGFKEGYHLNCLDLGYTEVSESEFLAEFGKPKVEYQYFTGGKWQDIDMPVRIKPTPDYSKEIEALQAKAKENGMNVTIKFEKL